MGGLDRRSLFSGAGAFLVAAQGARAAQSLRSPRLEPAQYSWSPPPPLRSSREGLAPLAGAKLWFWDTGGSGEPIILLHAATGSSEAWGYQQQAFAAAGHRVIAYSRRGHGKSEAGSERDAGTGAGDLRALADHLELDRFHLLGSAAGGFIAPDFALAFPHRLRSMILACTQGGVTDPAYRAATEAMNPPGWRDLPAAFRELGPSYRAGNPQGVKAWETLEHDARPVRINQGALNALSWSAIGRIRTPTLLIGGSADLLMAPSRVVDYARRLPGAEAAIIADAGHSAYWEQPLAFNRLVLDFLRRHRARGASKA